VFTVADASVGSACTACWAGVRFSSTGASVAVCAKLSEASAADSDFMDSSLANLLWKDGAIHRGCRNRKAGVMVVMDRGLTKVAEGVEAIARAAVRRRRNLAKI
jgi:hypothetical protein